MRKILILILFSIPLTTFSQKSLKDIRKKSWQTLVFRISTDDAIKYEKWDSIPLYRFIDLPIKNIFPSDSIFEDKLPVGHYVFISVIDNKVKAELYNRSDLRILTVNNKNNLQIDVRNKRGNFISDAVVFVNGQKAIFNTASQTHWISKKSFAEAIVIVYAEGDTLITKVSAQDDLQIPISSQKRSNYRTTKIYKLLNWIPRTVLNLVSNKSKHKRIGASGFIVFNQPKYKPLDTVKFKGYIVDKRWKQYSKPIEVFFNYYARGKNYNQYVTILKPISPGAYAYQFIIADSIPTDITCYLNFKTSSGKDIINNRFKIEDYVLDEIETQEFRADKETYFKNDSLRFFASAKDANGLNVMDATARLVLTTQTIERFYQDKLFVPDTVYNTQIKLKTDAETKFVISTQDFPKADLTIKAKLIFKNANNELQEKEKTIFYRYNSKTIFVQQLADSIKTVYLENGLEKIAEGTMEVDDEEVIKIKYPYSIKIDPIAENYTFYLQNETDSLKEVLRIKKNYDVSFSRISLGDTLGFELNNPYRIPVYYTVFNGAKIIAVGKKSVENIQWKKLMKVRRQMYKVRWQYYWAGKEFNKEESIGLLYKLLKVKIENNDNVFPGQTDSLKINVTDYKGNAAANVNLTALSYNNQFKNDIRVKDPPYLVKYRSKKYIERDGFEADEKDETIFAKNYLLGKNVEWKNKFGLDSMEFYKLLFPQNTYYDAIRPLNSIMPQISVNVVSNGVPQEIYLLYINRQLAYYNGVTDRMNYSFEVYPENAQIGIRLRDKYIQIDSLYIQPYYKHDLSFDINHLPAGAVITPENIFWSNAEMQLLERSMWQMQNNLLNNNAYLWQNISLVKLNGNNEHIAGPFIENEPMQFFNPLNFDVDFKFEPGYQYNLSKQVLRLEKKLIFPNKIIKNKILFKPGYLLLGDTITVAPAIVYPVFKGESFLNLTKEKFEYYNGSRPNKGKIFITSLKDSFTRYIVLKNLDSSFAPLVFNGSIKTITGINAGRYLILLVTNSFKIAAAEIFVNINGTTCIKMDSSKYFNGHPLISQLTSEAKNSLAPTKENTILKNEPVIIYTTPDSIIYTKTGGGIIEGVIKDLKGKQPIPFCTIYLKGSKLGVQANASGAYIFKNIRPGKYTIIFMQIGYTSKEAEIEIDKGGHIRLDIMLVTASQNLEDVVVTGYGTKLERNLTGSITSISTKDLSSVNNGLTGKIAGINIKNESAFLAGGNINLRMRGLASTLNGNPIYVVDGIIYTSAPKISSEMITDVTVLKGEEAVALFGSQAVDGAILITTNTKTERKDFRDYAFWVPNFFTDKNGKAAVEVTYPDNVTGWQTYVLAMDKKRRMGKGSVLTQSYKPMLAQLNLPLFLTEGDTSYFVTKSFNYTAENYNVKTEFIVNGAVLATTEKKLLPHDASIEPELITIKNTDTISVAFGIKSATGFKDREERKIPVFKKGTEETAGNFWVLQKDTTFSITTKSGISSVNLYAQNNTLDVLLEELENLKRYPYYCIEQICSKITGLVLEKKIKEKLNQPFKSQKELDRLLIKIQKAQQFDGGWAWWENGKSNLHITNYAANALLVQRENPLIEANIRNAFIYLQNKLPYLKKNELLTSLLSLSNGNHEMDYATWINKIDFDSINQHQQWQWVKIKQQQKMIYKAELARLVRTSIASILGGIHWGTENYRWYSNEIATTTLAFDVLKNEPQYNGLLPKIIQYFIEKKQNGYWRNTVETASIINTILPHILSVQENFQSAPQLIITGDTSFTVSNFPYQVKINNPALNNFTIAKKGGGLIYFTAYQSFFNTDPIAVENNFILQTSFKKNDQSVTTIKSGERIKMLIMVEVLKDAEYVMLTIPIPAGCIFSNKNNNDWKIFKEYQKDKLLLFAESLSKGTHQFEVELEPRYNGNYTLNPAKAALMYYPTFYGRNAIRKISIEK